MSSGYSPWIYRKILYRIPGLFKVCPGGNYHWFFDRLCFCRLGDHIALEWHGGIYDLKTGQEYQECAQCQTEDIAKREDQLDFFNQRIGYKNPCRETKISKKFSDMLNGNGKK